MSNPWDSVYHDLRKPFYEGDDTKQKNIKAAKKGKRWQDDDGDGKWYEKSDVDGKISTREKKKKHDCASKVKHEEFGIGNCIPEMHDLDESGNVSHYDVEFAEYIVEGVPAEELEILEGHMHEHVIREKMAAKDYDGDGKVESGKDEYFGSKDKAIKKAMGKKIKEGVSNWRHDLKEIPDYEQIPVSAKDRNKKIEEKKVKNSVKINPNMEEGYGDKKKKKHDCASKVKHEQFGVGNCISEAHDLDENGNVAHYDVEFGKYTLRNVPVEDLEILEGHMHEHAIREGSYEATKTKEVMGALKKRDLKKDVKKKIAADIVKRKGDTSKSDDRYAYENYQAMRNPEKEEKKDTRTAKQKRMDSPDKGINSPAFKEFMRSRGM